MVGTKVGKYILFGLHNYEKVINEIIEELVLFEYSFDIKLLLTEAIVNAFKHGNKEDIRKPIFLNYKYIGYKVIFRVRDSGQENRNIVILDEISEENILDENGRGLFLIKCLSDKVKLMGNTLVIEKSLIHAI